MATYFKGNVGSTSVNKTAFEKSSGASTSFEGTVPYNFGGEFGVLFCAKSVGLRLGVEVVNPRKQQGIEGKDSAGTKLLTLDSSIIAVVPSAHVEFYFEQKPTRKYFLSIGAGAATVTMVNSYSMTAAGTAAYPGITDFTEEGTLSSIMLDGSAGLEFSLADNATMVLDVGYRTFTAADLKHSRAATTLNGVVLPGNNVTNSDGAKRSLNLSGPYAGFGFRFYISL